MTIFYDDGYVRITERWLYVGRLRYPLDQLRNLRKTRIRARSNAFVLLADLHESPVLLYHTTDAVVFGTVTRALLRAVERRGRQLNTLKRYNCGVGGTFPPAPCPAQLESH